MRFRLAALLIPCLALGGCVSRGDGSVLEVVLVDEGAAGQGVVIGAAAQTEGSDIASLTPLPPPRPPEFGGVVLAASDEELDELDLDDDEPTTSAGAAPAPGLFQWLASAPSRQAAAVGLPQTADKQPTDMQPADMQPSDKPRGPGFHAAYAYTRVDCFPEQLKTALDQIAVHYKKPVEVASGYRPNGRRGSMHRHCMAADIRIDGVEPMALATYAKTVPGINGVGTYRRTDLVHVDVRHEQFAWRH